MYKRVLLKISGEALLGKDGSPIDNSFLTFLSSEIKMLVDEKIDVAVVVGGGNIFRGLSESKKTGIDRVTGDHMGMLATVINSLALKSAFEKAGMTARVMTAIEIDRVAEPFIRGKAERHLEKGRVVIFGAGTGNPFFTTDTAAALRASEIKADLLVKATKVDGLYSEDPMKNKDAKFIKQTTFKEAIKQNLKVMDTSALSLCSENNIPVKIVNIFKSGNIYKAVKTNEIGSIVTN